MNRRGAERLRLRAVLLTIVINISAVIIFASVSWSDWQTGLYLSIVDNLILIVFVLYQKDRMMAHLLIFGIVLGFVELAADAWLVDFTGTLDYSVGGGPMVWRSPLWMPLAWQIVAVQFGYLGMRLRERLKLKGLLLTGLIGTLNIPFYEEMALRTNWWMYRDCKMFLHTPYYIIFGEFLIVLCIASLAKNVRQEHFPKTIAAGVLGGAVIFFSYAVSFWIFERIL